MAESVRVSSRMMKGREREGAKTTRLTLTVELLDELQHHTVQGSFPKDVPSREALEPGSLSTLVLESESIVEVLDLLRDGGIVCLDVIEHGDGLPGTFLVSSSDEKSGRLGKEENTRAEDETEEDLDSDGDLTRRRGRGRGREGQSDS